MKWLNVITLLLLIVGGVNWGLVAMGGHEMDLVANLFGGDDAALAKVVYGLVGLSALWQIMPWVKSLSMGETHAEAGHRDVGAMR
ncbi:DUF378 domain-containing protein [Phenylobacterium sp.]|uniref:DUF378 domain-containing protein n=1 Tax=Phenylobacterium sp. TaxID=1871053 RepID=UPI0035AE870E